MINARDNLDVAMDIIKIAEDHWEKDETFIKLKENISELRVEQIGFLLFHILNDNEINIFLALAKEMIFIYESQSEAAYERRHSYD